MQPPTTRTIPHKGCVPLVCRLPHMKRIAGHFRCWGVMFKKMRTKLGNWRGPFTSDLMQCEMIRNDETDERKRPINALRHHRRASKRPHHKLCVRARRHWLSALVAAPKNRAFSAHFQKVHRAITQAVQSEADHLSARVRASSRAQGPVGQSPTTSVSI